MNSPVALPRANEPQSPFSRRLGGAQNQSGLCGVDTNCFLLVGKFSKLGRSCPKSSPDTNCSVPGSSFCGDANQISGFAGMRPRLVLWTCADVSGTVATLMFRWEDGDNRSEQNIGEYQASCTQWCHTRERFYNYWLLFMVSFKVKIPVENSSAESWKFVLFYNCVIFLSEVLLTRARWQRDIWQQHGDSVTSTKSMVTAYI